MTNEEAIKTLKETLYDEKTSKNYLEAVRMARESLENQKTGYWIRCDILQEFKCSECRVCFRNKSSFCPNCGAKMEGE